MRIAYVLRHLLSITALPFTVTVLVPRWLARRPSAPFIGDTMPRAVSLALGVVTGAIGLALFLSSLRRFATEGEGTLAPWDPPRRLVVRGPYRYVRNPMISGVIFILFAEACLLDSRAQLAWALIFLIGNTIHIPLIEEPGLRHRFGASYDDYRNNVPRLIPRLRPWEPRRIP